MKRRFQETDSFGDDIFNRPKCRGLGYTDQDLESRFAGNQSTSGAEELMDEAAARRMVAAQRHQSSASKELMDEATARRMIAAEKQKRNETPAAVHRPDLRQRSPEPQQQQQSPAQFPPAPPSPREEERRHDEAMRQAAAERALERTLEMLHRDEGHVSREEVPNEIQQRTPEPQQPSPPREQEARHAEPSGAPASLQPPSHAAPPPVSAPLPKLAVGDTVLLTGLQAAVHLNGQRGRLVKLDANTGRWEVKLESGEKKAIKPENIVEAEPETVHESPGFAAQVAPQSPEASAPGHSQPEVAPRSPPGMPAPPAAPAVQASTASAASGSGRAGGGAGEVAGLSSAALASSAERAVSSRSVPPPKTSRKMGTIRWYNGRRKFGCVIPDNGHSDLFIPAQGALNGSQVPPQPGGLFHGTRVSYLPAALKPTEAQAAGTKHNDIVCLDVRPLAGQVGLSCGVDTTAGAKERNDDRLAATDLHELGFLAGVFDGHRGYACADYVAKQLPSAILSAYRARSKREGGVAKLTHVQEAALISNSIIDAFEATDKAFLVTARKKEWGDGSTGLVGLLTHGFEVPLQPSSPVGGVSHLWPKREPSAPERLPGTVARAPGGIAKLFIAWCGDSRAVICRGRLGLRCTEDHRPSRKDERERIRIAGGVVAQDAHGIWRVGQREESKFARELEKRKKKESAVKWYLSTSRSFGDPELKNPDPIISATPEVKVVDIVPDDWAVVLATDGIFDVLSDQEVADVLWKSMVVHGKDPVGAAKAVVQQAFSGGSRDNLTAVVMRLGWSTPPLPDGSGTLGGSMGTVPAEAKASDDVNMFG